MFCNYSFDFNKNKTVVQANERVRLLSLIKTTMIYNYVHVRAANLEAQCEARVCTALQSYYVLGYTSIYIHISIYIYIYIYMYIYIYDSDFIN